MESIKTNLIMHAPAWKESVDRDFNQPQTIRVGNSNQLQIKEGPLTEVANYGDSERVFVKVGLARRFY